MESIISIFAKITSSYVISYINKSRVKTIEEVEKAQCLKLYLSILNDIYKINENNIVKNIQYLIYELTVDGFNGGKIFRKCSAKNTSKFEKAYSRISDINNNTQSVYLRDSLVGLRFILDDKENYSKHCIMAQNILLMLSRNIFATNNYFKKRKILNESKKQINKKLSSEKNIILLNSLLNMSINDFVNLTSVLLPPDSELDEVPKKYNPTDVLLIFMVFAEIRKTTLHKKREKIMVFVSYWRFLSIYFK